MLYFIYPVVLATHPLWFLDVFSTWQHLKNDAPVLIWAPISHFIFTVMIDCAFKWINYLGNSLFCTYHFRNSWNDQVEGVWSFKHRSSHYDNTQKKDENSSVSFVFLLTLSSLINGWIWGSIRNEEATPLTGNHINIAAIRWVRHFSPLFATKNAPIVDHRVCRFAVFRVGTVPTGRFSIWVLVSKVYSECSDTSILQLFLIQSSSRIVPRIKLPLSEVCRRQLGHNLQSDRK